MKESGPFDWLVKGHNVSCTTRIWILGYLISLFVCDLSILLQQNAFIWCLTSKRPNVVSLSLSCLWAQRAHPFWEGKWESRKKQQPFWGCALFLPSSAESLPFREAFANSPTYLPVSLSSDLIGPSYLCAIKVAPSHLASDGFIHIRALLRQFNSTNIYWSQTCAQACLCQAQWVDTEMNQTQPQRTYSQWGRQTVGTDTIN